MMHFAVDGGFVPPEPTLCVSYDSGAYLLEWGAPWTVLLFIFAGRDSYVYELYYRESPKQRMPYVLAGAPRTQTMQELEEALPLYYKGG